MVNVGMFFSRDFINYTYLYFPDNPQTYYNFNLFMDLGVLLLKSINIVVDRSTMSKYVCPSNAPASLYWEDDLYICSSSFDTTCPILLEYYNMWTS